MKIRVLALICLSSYLFLSCKHQKEIKNLSEKRIEEAAVTQPPPVLPAEIPTGKTDSLLVSILQQYPQYFDSILRKPDDYRLQIIYTQIDRGPNNMPVFTPYYYQVDPNRYFYPASTVKMPTALLALQKLREMKLPGVNKFTTMVTDSAYSRQTPVFNDPTTPDGKPNVAQYIRKIFMVSDNDAYNRLYEFLGQEYLNEQLRKKGYSSAEIIHHLEVVMTQDENRHTNPVTFLGPAGDTLFHQPMQVSALAPVARHDLLGTGFERNGQLVNQPFDFSRKNRISLEDLTGILKAILFPQAVSEQQRFNIDADDYRFVWKYMSQYPQESVYPPYDTSFQDAYAKYLYYGAEKGGLPKQFRIFNKIGDAYGFLVDAAYFADFGRKIEFMLSATILANKDGVFNDSKYDYETIGFPFMKNLGRVIYEYELKRTRKNAPDLNEFKLLYDK
ncbi:serine hydrolase [Pseudoflavitalea rhizosphaerae]|uniref:serine hydrolase n=1 Tax=Pseudoflavitalea rhizosphaerae TaxID=1884793 RepID=UPI0019D08E04|nr:serine hydrolase [Pseudoflavitalea rhizosphaerae]